MSDSPETRAIDCIRYRVQTTLDQVGGAFPFYADTETGEWETTADGNWCGGHWVGLLWLAAETTDQRADHFERAVREYTDGIGWDALHGSLFGGMNARYAGFRAADSVAGMRDQQVARDGAEAVAMLFDERAAVVPVGSFGTRGLERHSQPDRDGVAAVDALYTAVSLLWKAATAFDEPRYAEIARWHTQTHLDWFVRPDGGVWHKTTFDTETGSPVEQYNQLTRAAGTCWSRGLGWSVAGLVDAYNATKDDELLDAIDKHVTFYQEHTPDDDVPFAEMGAASPRTYRDTSAAAILAYGLVRLEGSVNKVPELRAYGRAVRTSLIHNYLVADGPLRGQLVEGCYNAVDEVAPEHELVWATYYLLYSLVVDSGERP